MVRRAANILNKHTIRTIVLNLLTTTLNGGFLRVLQSFNEVEFEKHQEKERMKTKTLIAVTITAIISATSTLTSNAETCAIANGCADITIPSQNPNSGKCLGAVGWYCYYDNKGTLKGPFASCAAGCIDGYTGVTPQNWYDNIQSPCNNNINVRPINCVLNTSLCGECNSTTWNEIPSIPYATRTHKWCDGATCKSESQIGCKIGYYGTPTAIGSGCNRCPIITDTNNVYSTTVAIGATDITSCYVPIGTAFSNSTGSGIYTVDSNGSPCYYSK